MRDNANIEKYARALGAGDYFKIFSFILTWRPFSSKKVGLSGGLTSADMEGVKKEWEESDPNISKLLEKLDRGCFFFVCLIVCLNKVENRIVACVANADDFAWNQRGSGRSCE
jgi:hypothetical protein